MRCCFCVFNVTVWIVCALVCDGVKCVCVRVRVLLCCLGELFSSLFENVCAYCLVCVV